MSCNNEPKSKAALSKRSALLFGSIILAGSVLFGAFKFSSVCTRCGMISKGTEWQFPLTSFTLFRTSSESETPVSLELVRSGAARKHEHQWLFIAGGGNGVTCAIGQGRHIRPVVQSQGVASILAASLKFGEVAFHDRIVELMFDPKTSEAVRGLAMSVPADGFGERQEFRRWLDEETEHFDQMVALYRTR